MHTFSDRLYAAVEKKGNPCIVGLDPRIDQMPHFALKSGLAPENDTAIRLSITDFHLAVLDIIAPMVPAVKLQIAFYEQYGLAGLEAFQDTVRAAKARDLLVIVDAKRSDISSTAEAYANAFLGRTTLGNVSMAAFDVDCITVNPFLGRDSLLPFVNTCEKYGKGIFVLVKTSNPGSVDIQDQILASSGSRLQDMLATMVDELGHKTVGESGYSSIGAVVGATFPYEAERLRALMPCAIFLVPGYGAQGGTGMDAAACFNNDGRGAVVNASRSITYAFSERGVSMTEVKDRVGSILCRMINDVNYSVRERCSAQQARGGNRGVGIHRV